MTEKTFAKIYGITDQNGRVMYIGKSNNPIERMKQHIRDCKHRHTPLYGWINKSLERGKQPKMIVLASAITSDWQSLEIKMIDQYRIEGHMLNLADGGDQPHVSQETRISNGHALNKRLNADSILKRVRSIKQSMRNFIKRCDEGKIRPEVKQRIQNKLKYAGHKNPTLFGEYRYL